MTIVTFENSRKEPLSLVVNPWGLTHEIPHRGEAGIRYTLKEGAEDRSYTSLSEDGIEFWCNADSYEIDIVQPSAFENLLWDICVGGGWCGGLVNGEPTTVEDLLPREGEVTAKEFARLTILADGWPSSQPMDEKHLHWIEGRFKEQLGAASAPADALRRTAARPFGDAAS